MRGQCLEENSNSMASHPSNQSFRQPTLAFYLNEYITRIILSRAPTKASGKDFHGCKRGTVRIFSSALEHHKGIATAVVVMSVSTDSVSQFDAMYSLD